VSANTSIRASRVSRSDTAERSTKKQARGAVQQCSVCKWRDAAGVNRNQEGSEKRQSEAQDASLHPETQQSAESAAVAAMAKYAAMVNARLTGCATHMSRVGLWLHRQQREER